MHISVYGASDDLIEFEGSIYDEFNWYSSEPWLAELVASNGESVIVSAQYRSDVSAQIFEDNDVDEDIDWLITVLPASGEDDLPDWGFEFLSVSPECDYSTQVNIVAPDNTILKHISHIEE